MASFREIVTKAVIGKGKKQFTDNLSLQAENTPTTVLGCWVINHTFSGEKINNIVNITGSYDINVWYSYDNNTKTNVLVKRFTYQDTMNVKIKENSELTSSSDIIVRALNQPSVTDVSVDGMKINLTVHKEMGVEIVGDTKVRVSVEDEFEDYEEIVDDVVEDNNTTVDTNSDNIEITDDYLN